MKIAYLTPKIKEIVSKYLDLSEYDLFLFGSRIKGDNSGRSDVDIGIEGKKKIPAYIKISIEDELEELPTLCKIDLVDFKLVSPGFKKEAKKHLKYIN